MNRRGYDAVDPKQFMGARERDYANAALSRQAKKDEDPDEFLTQVQVLYPSEAEFYDATFKSLRLLECASARTEK